MPCLISRGFGFRLQQFHNTHNSHSRLLERLPLYQQLIEGRGNCTEEVPVAATGLCAGTELRVADTWLSYLDEGLSLRNSAIFSEAKLIIGWQASYITHPRKEYYNCTKEKTMKLFISMSSPGSDYRNGKI